MSAEQQRIRQTKAAAFKSHQKAGTTNRFVTSPEKTEEKKVENQKPNKLTAVLKGAKEAEGKGGGCIEKINQFATAFFVAITREN